MDTDSDTSDSDSGDGGPAAAAAATAAADPTAAGDTTATAAAADTAATAAAASGDTMYIVIEEVDYDSDDDDYSFDVFDESSVLRRVSSTVRQVFQPAAGQAGPPPEMRQALLADLTQTVRSFVEDLNEGGGAANEYKHMFVTVLEDVTHLLAAISRDADALSVRVQHAVDALSASPEPGTEWTGAVCPVCEGHVETVFPCAHAFCLSCTLRWRAKKSGCPVCRQEAAEVLAVERRASVPHPFQEPHGASHAVFGPLWRAVWQHRTLSSFGFWVAATLLGGPVGSWALPQAATAGTPATLPHVVVVTETDALGRAVTQVMGDVDVILAAAPGPAPGSGPAPLRKPVFRLCGTLNRQETLQTAFSAKQCHLVVSYQDVCNGTSVAPGAVVLLVGSTDSKTKWADTVAAAGIVHRRLKPCQVVNATWRVPA
jgi:hypothetical protein